jgi:surface carbohydrate biosynthesis protein
MNFKSIEMLNIKKGYIVVPEYLKDEYLEQGYFLLPKNLLIKKIYKFFYVTILRKIIIILEFLKKNRIYFQLPQKKEIIIFDDENIAIFRRIFTKDNYFILPTRSEKIKDIYLSKNLFLYIVKNFFKRSIKLNYLIFLIKFIDPKTVITFIDNSEDFSKVSKILHDENINFVAVQNSHRYEIHAKNKELYIPRYYVFGNYEVEIFKKNLGIKEIKPIGSLSASVIKKHFDNQKVTIISNKYNICLVSEPRLKLNHDFKRIHALHNVQESIGLIANHTLRFCKNNNKSVIFSGKADSKSFNFQSQEKKFYKKFIENFDTKISFNNKKKFEQYKNLMESDLIIGMSSTLLREAFGFKKKILICNFINHEDAKPPSKGICTLDSTNYSDFENRVNKILSLTYEEYITQIENIENIYNMNINALDFLKNELI